MSSQTALGRAFLLGAVSGLRSLLGTALIGSEITQHNRRALIGTPLAPLANDNVVKTLRVLSAGEILADKLPGIPARTQPGPLLGRALFGALAGAAVCAEERESLAAGAIVGAVGAVVATFGAYHLRQWLDNRVGLPDPVVAVAEDAFAVTLGRQILRS